MAALIIQHHLVQTCKCANLFCHFWRFLFFEFQGKTSQNYTQLMLIHHFYLFFIGKINTLYHRMPWWPRVSTSKTIGPILWNQICFSTWNNEEDNFHQRFFVQRQSSSKLRLVGGFNPFETYSSIWIISPNRGEHKTCLKPPPRRNCFFWHQYFASGNRFSFHPEGSRITKPMSGSGSPFQPLIGKRTYPTKNCKIAIYKSSQSWKT